jgi:hypothetical protein
MRSERERRGKKLFFLPSGQKSSLRMPLALISNMILDSGAWELTHMQEKASRNFSSSCSCLGLAALARNLFFSLARIVLTSQSRVGGFPKKITKN